MLVTSVQPYVVFLNEEGIVRVAKNHSVSIGTKKDATEELSTIVEVEGDCSPINGQPTPKLASFGKVSLATYFKLIEQAGHSVTKVSLLDFRSKEKSRN